MLIYADLSVFPISLRRNIPILHCKINIKQINIAMKKLLFLFAVLLTSVGAWAQETYTVTVDLSNGSFTTTGNYKNRWYSTVTDAQPFQLSLYTNNDNNNMNVHDGNIQIHTGGDSGANNTCTYNIEVPQYFQITGYSFTYCFGINGNATTSTDSKTIYIGDTPYVVSNENATLQVSNLATPKTQFRVDGYNQPVKLTNFTVTVTTSGISNPTALKDGAYYTFQCAGSENKKYANYQQFDDRIATIDLGRYNGSVYKIKEGPMTGVYTIQTYDDKYLIYKGYGEGDQIAVKAEMDITNANKWWVISQGTSAENSTIVPLQTTSTDKKGFNFSVNYGGANGALGFWGISDGNSQWTIQEALMPITRKIRIKCEGIYVRHSGENLIKESNEANLDDECIFTLTECGGNKYTIQTNDGKYVTYSSTEKGNNVNVTSAENVTDANKWWLVTPDITGNNTDLSTACKVDIYPYKASISKSDATWNWIKNVTGENTGIGIWDATHSNSWCEFENVESVDRFVYIYSARWPSTPYYLGVKFEGGKLDNSSEPSTHVAYSYHETPNYKHCWKLIPTTYTSGETTENGYYLYNPYYDWYLGYFTSNETNVGLSKTSKWAGIYKMQDQGSNKIAFNCLNATASMKYLHQSNSQSSPRVINYNLNWGGSLDSGSAWYIEDVNIDFAEYEWFRTLSLANNTLKTQLEQITLGTGIGEYHGTTSEVLAQVTEALVPPALGSNTEKIQKAIGANYDATIVDNNLSLNMPPLNKFYRIQSQNGNYDDRRGKYLQNTSVVNSEGTPVGLELSNNTGNNSIMYIDDTKKILSYASGQYLNGYTQQSTVGTEGTAWEIVENNSIKTKYALRRNGATDANQYLSDWNSAERVMDGQNDASAAWTFEIVEALPFTFNSKALGFATFCAPVNVEIPNDVTAYVAEIQGKTLKMRKFVVEDGEKLILPAETPVMLYKADLTEATIQLRIVAGEYTLSDEDKAKNNFFGTIAAEKLLTDETYNYYSLQKNAFDDSKVGFYRKAEGDDKVLGGFKAWIKIEEAEDLQARAFTIIFDGDDATGLKEALGLENENVEIYDLSGRRLDKPAKGVNVIGGKLVIK